MSRIRTLSTHRTWQCTPKTLRQATKVGFGGSVSVGRDTIHYQPPFAIAVEPSKRHYSQSVIRRKPLLEHQRAGAQMAVDAAFIRMIARPDSIDKSAKKQSKTQKWVIVSESGEREANGCYYQEQWPISPPRYVQTNGRHEIVQQTRMMNHGYGGSYSQTVWILQRIDPSTGSRCALYVTYSQDQFANGVPFGFEFEWESISGSLPLPRVRNGMVRQQRNQGLSRKEGVSRKEGSQAMSTMTLQPPKTKATARSQSIEQKWVMAAYDRYGLMLTMIMAFWIWIAMDLAAVGILAGEFPTNIMSGMLLVLWTMAKIAGGRWFVREMM